MKKTTTTISRSIHKAATIHQPTNNTNSIALLVPIDLTAPTKSKTAQRRKVQHRSLSMDHFGGPQQTTYEAQNSAIEQRLSTSTPYLTFGAQQYPRTYDDGYGQYPSDDQQSYPSTYNSIPTYGAQQSSVSYGSQYNAAQQPYPKTHNAPYSVIYPGDAFDSASDITDPRLYKKGITAFARASLNRT